MTLRIARSHHRHVVMPAAPHFSNPLTQPLSAVPAAPAAPVSVMLAPQLHARVSTLRHRRLQVSRIMPTCAPHMGSLLKQRRCDPARRHHLSFVSVDTCKYHPSGNTSCTFISYLQKECKHRPCGNHHASVQTLVRDVDLFPSLGPWFFPWSNLDKPNLTGSDTLILWTVISCITNTFFEFFSGTQAERAGTPPIPSQRLVDGFMQLHFKKPVITFLTSPISSLRTLATRTSPSCSPRHLRPRPYGFRLQGRLHKQRYVVYGPTHRPRSAALPVTFWNIDGHILFCTHPQCRGQET